MRVVLPEFIDQKAAFSYLKEHKKSLIAQKCLAPIKTDVFEYGCLGIKAKDKKTIGKGVSKQVGENDKLSDNELEVDAIANMAGWCDSHMDVLMPDNWKETIRVKGASGKQLIYHLKNHIYSTDAIIGGDVKMRAEWLDLSIFNIENTDLKQGQALIGNSIVKRKYDPKSYELYADDEIKQHSIGLRYVRIFLCINSTEDDMVVEKENWDKYHEFVINKDKVENKGFFWAVTEIKLLEYSAVLFGSNELTTVQDTTEKTEPPAGTPKKKPSADTSKTDMLNYLLNT